MGIEDLGSNVERMSLRAQAQAVAMFLETAKDAMESAKTAAEMMDAEQALEHMHLVRPAAKTLMAARLGIGNAAAAFTALADQLPRVAVVGTPPAREDRKGPVLEHPAPLCKACGGRRRIYDEKKRERVPCKRCGATGVEP